MEPDDLRIGPLSYSLDAPEGDFSAERPIILGSLIAFAAAIVVTPLGWWVTGMVGPRRPMVWLGASIVVAVGVVAAVLLSPGRRRRRRNAVLGVGAASLLFAWFTHLALESPRPSVAQLRYAVDGVELPDGFRLVSEESGGNRLCDPRCPEVVRVYEAGPQVQDPGRDLLRAFFAQGWSLGNPAVPPDANSSAVRPPFQVDVFTTTGERTVRLVVAPYRVPAGGGGDGGR